MIKSYQLVLTLLLFCSFEVYSQDSELEFAWPVPSSVRVTETKISGINAIKVSYDVRLERYKEGGLLVSFVNFDLLSFNTRKPSAEERDQVLPVVALQPNLHISEAGDVIEVVGFDQYLRNYAAVVGGVAGTGLLQNQAFLDGLYEAVQERWCNWVCNWAGMRYQIGKKMHQPVEMMVMNFPLTGTVDMRIKKSAIYPGNIDLNIEQHIDPESAKQQILTFAKELAQDEILSAQEREALNVTQLDRVERSAFVYAALDPNSMKPTYVEVEERTYIAAPGEVEQRHEMVKYEFVWD